MQTHTHIGYRPHTGYVHCGVSLWGHRIPKAGKVHALTAEGTGFRSLCGEYVGDNRGVSEYGDETARNVETATNENGGRVTCKRCQAAIRRNQRS